MRWLLILLAVVPAPAFADLTAVYGRPGTSFDMKIEIAANGDVHCDMPGQDGLSTFTLGGQGYLIKPGPSGSTVIRYQDAAAVMKEQIAKAPAIHPDPGHAPVLSFVQKGTATVNGRTGLAYFVQMSGGQLSPRPRIVISDDPTLAPLARAMASQFDLSMNMWAQALVATPAKPMLDILRTGAPIVFAGLELQTVSFDPIPASHFALPAKPASLDEVRSRMMSSAPKP